MASRRVSKYLKVDQFIIVTVWGDRKIKKLLMISKTSKIVSKSKTIILDLKLSLGVTMSSE